MTTMNKKQVINKLEIILATTKVLQYKVQSFHWNIEGQYFFQLHEKFEEYYNKHSSDLDEIAERIRQLGGHPPSSIAQLLELSQIPETLDRESSAMVDQLISNYKTYTHILLDFSHSEETDTISASITEGIATYIEKQLWMLQSFNA